MTQNIVDIIGLVLTIMVLSRIAGDNPVFRAAQYLFVGVSLGLAFVVAYHQVLRPAVLIAANGDTTTSILYGIPLALGLLLLFRITPDQEMSWVANIPLALIFGVGAALAIGGAIVGTLLPQILDTARPISGSPAQMVGAIVLAIGTIIILSSFYYTVPDQGVSGRVVAMARVAGHWLLMVAFGFFFASALQSYLTALTERLQFILRLVGLVA